MRILALIVTCSILLSFSAEHKFYMSLTDVAYDADSEQIRFTSRFFTDDVERAISSDEALLKIDASMDERFLPLLNSFYAEQIDLKVDGKEQDLRFIGYEVENELLWCYAEVSDIPRPQDLQISGRWLFDLFDDQVNIINVHIGEVQSAYLSPDDPEREFRLEP